MRYLAGSLVDVVLADAIAYDPAASSIRMDDI